MNTDLLQSVVDIVFQGNLLFLSPILFLLMTILFSDRLIDLIYNALGRNSGRRNRY